MLIEPGRDTVIGCDRIAVAIGDRSGRFTTASLTHPEPILINAVDGPSPVLGAGAAAVSDSAVSPGQTAMPSPERATTRLQVGLCAVPGVGFLLCP